MYSDSFYQADEHHDLELLYLQVNYRCIDAAVIIPDRKPLADLDPVSVRDYMISDSDQIASNILSDDGLATAPFAQASRSGGSGKDNHVDHTSTIVGGILLGVGVIGAFLIAYLLDKTRKKRDERQKILLSTGRDGPIVESKVVGSPDTGLGAAVESKAGVATASARAAHLLDSDRVFKTVGPGGDKDVSVKIY